MQEHEIKAFLLTIARNQSKINKRIDELAEEIRETQNILAAYVDIMGPEELKDIYKRTTFISEELMEMKKKGK